MPGYFDKAIGILSNTYGLRPATALDKKNINGKTGLQNLLSDRRSPGSKKCLRGALFWQFRLKLPYNLLCYATVSPTGDYGYDRTKYDSFQEHNIGSVLEGIPKGIIAHNEVGNGIFTRVYKAEQALSKSEIDGIIQEIIKLSKPYPPMNDIKLANIKNIITHIDCIW